jgi:hypothetical protein
MRATALDVLRIREYTAGSAKIWIGPLTVRQTFSISDSEWSWPVQCGDSMEYVVRTNRSGKWLSTAAGGAAGLGAGPLTALAMSARSSGVAKMHLHCASILLVWTQYLVSATMPRRADLRPAPVASVAALG